MQGNSFETKSISTAACIFSFVIPPPHAHTLLLCLSISLPLSFLFFFSFILSVRFRFHWCTPETHSTQAVCLPYDSVRKEISSFQRERERESERERERETERDRERQRERQRETETETERGVVFISPKLVQLFTNAHAIPRLCRSAFSSLECKTERNHLSDQYTSAFNPDSAF